MHQEATSFAFRSYQTGRLFLVGVDRNRRLSMVQRAFTRAMGLNAGDQHLYVADLYQFWRFDNLHSSSLNL